MPPGSANAARTRGQSQRWNREHIRDDDRQRRRNDAPFASSPSVPVAAGVPVIAPFEASEPPPAVHRHSVTT